MVHITAIAFAAVVVVSLATSDAATRVVRSPQFGGGFSQANAQAGAFGGGFQPRPQFGPPGGFQPRPFGPPGPPRPFGPPGPPRFGGPGFGGPGFGGQGFGGPPSGSISISKSISISGGGGGGGSSASSSSNAGSFGK